MLGGLSYAGGVYYSLVSDNFHDFFTEYVPFGEDAVLYFEEREYRKRFPNITSPTNRPFVDGGHKVTIPSRSGVSWKVADEGKGSDLRTNGAHRNAKEDKKEAKAEDKENAQRTPSQATGKEITKAVESVKEDRGSSSSASKSSDQAPKAATSQKSAESTPPPAPKPTESAKPASPKTPEVNEPSIFMPIEPIDPLKIRNANEPLVQDLVKILNDIITVVNNDGSSHKYNSTIRKAKEALASVGGRILSLKRSEQQSARNQIASMQSQFDTGAKELISRLESEMRAQEGRWRDEFDSERDKLSSSYESRLESETKRAQEAMNARQENALLEQSIALKKQFLTQINDRVESERDGRLAKLGDLSSSVDELEKLTADWNAVIDANLRTQHLQVAVEAVRNILEKADRPRPFVRELAALKEIGAGDPVIDAAIASINPTAYQRGIPTPAQLIDRFRRVAGEVRKASLLPDDAGVASHAASVVMSKFLFKKKGMTVGDDVESILTRTETLLEEGNLDEAAREMNTLEGWAKTLSWDWLSECRRVLEVRQAMDVIGTEARLEGLKVDK